MKIKVLQSIGGLVLSSDIDAAVSPNKEMAFAYDSANCGWCLFNNIEPKQFAIIAEEAHAAQEPLKLDCKDMMHNFSMIDVIGAHPKKISIEFFERH